MNINLEKLLALEIIKYIGLIITCYFFGNLKFHKEKSLKDLFTPKIR